MLNEYKPVPVIPLEAFTGELYVKENKQSPAMQTLIHKCLVDLSEKLEAPPVAMQILGEIDKLTLFSKGNFSIITGAAKSRKTFFVSMLMASAIKGTFQNKFTCPTPGANILFDTEQSRYKSQQIGKRIYALCDNVNYSDNFDLYSLRTLEPSQRIDLIDQVLATTQHINFVAIDGIIDLDIDPILQAEQAQRIIMKLMQWTEIYNIHITCVLHYNKTAATLLGHLGSFSHRKADSIIEVSKSKEDDSISIVRAVDCREKEFSPFAFSVDETGLPYILEDYVIEHKENFKEAKTKPVFTISQLQDSEHKQILASVFKVDQMQGYTDCWRNIKNGIQTITGATLGDNKSKDCLAWYISENYINKKDQKKGKAVYAEA